MNRHMKRNRFLWFLTSTLAFLTAFTEVIRPAIYQSLVAQNIMPGIFAQDLMTLAAAVTVLILLFRLRGPAPVTHTVMLAFMGYLFYAYGIYVIERVYTVLYLVYMAVFGLSFYSIVHGVATFPRERLATVSVPGMVKKIAAGFLLLNPVIFYPLWISRIIPLIRAAQKIEALYSIYILDLCFIMPAFIIVGGDGLAKQKSGRSPDPRPV